MINENKELIITTSDAFEVIRIVNKLDMKGSIAKAMEGYVKLNNKKESNLLKLRKLIVDKVGEEEYMTMTVEDKQNNTQIILLENASLEEDMIKVNSDINNIAMDLTYEFVTKLPMAEKEIYKCLAKIFGKSAKEVEVQELDVTVEQISKIAKSKTIKGFFN